jgi:2-oxoisovalerate dehydrogenase E1 component
VTTPQDLDERFRAVLGAMSPTEDKREPDDPVRDGAALTGAQAGELFEAQLASRHLDLAARWLRSFDQGYYTIGSAGHEGNAAVAAALRPTDPALLHYRSGAFYCARAAQVPGSDAIRDVLRGLVASSREPIAGGRHKVFGNADLHVIPTTSTIGSHLPRAVGVAYAIGRGRRAPRLGARATGWPGDSVVVCSFGDASINHASALAGLNTAGWSRHTGLPLPLLFVCEDNGIGISMKSPPGWVTETLRSRPGIRYFAADGCDLAAAYDAAVEAVSWVRRQRRPAVLHLSMVRLMGHAGADAELAYRRPAEIAADLDRDPLLVTATLLVAAGVVAPGDLLDRYDEVGWEVRRVAEEVLSEPKLASPGEVTAPLAPRRPARVARAISEAATRLTAPAAEAAEPPAEDPLSLSAEAAPPAEDPLSLSAEVAPPPEGALAAESSPEPGAEIETQPDAEIEPSAASSAIARALGGIGVPGVAARFAAFGGRLPEEAGGLTLAQTVNATLTDALLAYPHLVVFGEDVAAKGGVYGVTKGLRDRFGAGRVFDTLLDETSILGLGLGVGLGGMLPVPEIQYLAYLHNAEDQLRGEAATMQFFSRGDYRNPMVVRVAGLAYQSGFGGHFHNDNSVAVLRDIPGVVVAVPARAEDAGPLLRTCLASAVVDGSVCVYLEPIALYHTRDLHVDSDGEWLAEYVPPERWAESHVPIGRARVYGVGSAEDLTIITFGNGVRISLRAAARLASDGVGCRVVDLRWLSPLPVADIIRESSSTGRVLVVDETRRSGGVGEGVLAALVDTGYVGVARRVAAVDSFIPLGPAAAQVLVSEEQILQAARSLLAR